MTSLSLLWYIIAMCYCTGMPKLEEFPEITSSETSCSIVLKWLMIQNTFIHLRGNIYLSDEVLTLLIKLMDDTMKLTKSSDNWSMVLFVKQRYDNQMWRYSRNMCMLVPLKTLCALKRSFYWFLKLKSTTEKGLHF